CSSPPLDQCQQQLQTTVVGSPAGPTRMSMNVSANENIPFSPNQVLQQTTEVDPSPLMEKVKEREKDAATSQVAGEAACHREGQFCSGIVNNNPETESHQQPPSLHPFPRLDTQQLQN